MFNHSIIVTIGWNVERNATDSQIYAGLTGQGPTIIKKIVI